MRNLVKADMKRILVKILPWLLLTAVYIYIAVTIVTGINTSIDRSYFFLLKITERTSAATLVIGFAALLGIYGDEFKSMVMIGVIGRGITRVKFVLAKFFDTMLLVALMLGITAIYVMVLKTVFGVSLNATQTMYLINLFVFEFVEQIAFVMIASIFYFLSENAAIGLFAYLAFLLIIPMTLTFAALLSPTVANLGLDRFYVSGLTNAASSSLIIGDIGGVFLALLPCIAIYIGGALLITMGVFIKKELDF